MSRKRFVIFYLLIGLGVVSSFVTPGPICKASQGEYVLLQTLGRKGSGEGEFNNPCGIAVDKKGQIYVADAGGNCIQKLTAEGNFLSMWKTTNQPRAIAVDDNGNVYVAEAGAEKGLIEKFTAEGKIIKKWEYQGVEFKGQNYSMPGGIAVSDRNIYLGNNSTGSIQKFSINGELIKSWGRLARCCGFLDVAVDAQENVYVAELGAHRVVKFD